MQTYKIQKLIDGSWTLYQEDFTGLTEDQANELINSLILNGESLEQLRAAEDYSF